jgi:hypothetical protein
MRDICWKHIPINMSHPSKSKARGQQILVVSMKPSYFGLWSLTQTHIYTLNILQFTTSPKFNIKSQSWQFPIGNPKPHNSEGFHMFHVDQMGEDWVGVSGSLVSKPRPVAVVWRWGQPRPSASAWCGRRRHCRHCRGDAPTILLQRSGILPGLLCYICYVKCMQNMVAWYRL